MLSQYPVLDNKPIDQWRVTELRDELRRRSLATKGLKEELVKRLDEAIQKERQSENEAELGNDVERNSDLHNNTDLEDVELEGADDTQPMLDEDNNTAKDASILNINHGDIDVNQEIKGQNSDAIEPVSSFGVDEGNAATRDDMEVCVAVNHNAATFHSGMQGEDAKLEDLKQPIGGTYEEKEATTVDLDGIAKFNPNITVQSDMKDEDAEPEAKFGESKPLAVESGEEKVATTVLQGSAHVSQNVTAQSSSKGEDAMHVDNFDDLMPPIVEKDEKAATAGELEGHAPVNQNIISQSGMLGEDAEPEEKFEDLKLLTVDSTFIQSEQSNQVSEISQDLGFQVKYESNSTETVTINEKNYIKDNLSAYHFPLEVPVVKQEVVQSSSSSYLSGVDVSLANDEQMDVKNEVSDIQHVGQNLLPDEREANGGNVANEQCLVQSYEQEVGPKHVSLKYADTQNASTVVLTKKEDCLEAGSSEKLNLDRSSGDESMEEDVLESKHMDPDIKFEEPTSTIEVKEERAAVDAATEFSSEMMDLAVEDVKPAALTDKRKLEEPEVVTNGAPKRQRRWNPDTIKVPEQRTPHLDIVMTPKNNALPTPRHTFSRSNSTLSVDSPKERIVPTSKKSATTSLRIDNFLRPFTLKAVQELLAQTGKVCDFWMDHIKTHCYVTYSSAEEATETRNAVYNLQWPPNGGRLLAAEFVDPQEVKSRLEVPPLSPVPISPTPATPKAPPPHQKSQAPQPTHQQSLRQQPLPPPPPLIHPPLPPPPSLSNPPPVAREQRLPPPPPKKPEPPVVTLDDLFKKTRATPRIYYLPLTEEQVSAKLATQGKSKYAQ
ncbi:xin actin-binding repeat-containing protein 2 [Phalaenopsis equestris]|uniref:xin actin-binding repeat-containing protein 2 n=1 Tax=Phalaenopsis equestris TaxID=78828 RepID=UPI0009E2B69C|nr:xin actin-binding repeat-containing protein 2 [Phalaenopsis equestris]